MWSFGDSTLYDAWLICLLSQGDTGEPGFPGILGVFGPKVGSSPKPSTLFTYYTLHTLYSAPPENPIKTSSLTSQNKGDAVAKAAKAISDAVLYVQ